MEPTASVHIGFIGLGRMGGALARNLVRAGHDVVLYDIRSDAVERVLAVGGRPAADARELAAGADVVFTSLPLPSDLEQMYLGEGGLLATMRPGSVAIDVSTIDPATARKLADSAREHGVRFLACPLGKGPQQAEEGTEPIFAGGDRSTFDRVRPILEAIGNPVHYLGDVEQSTAFKLISNLIGMTNMVVLAEGLRIGERAGIDPAQLQALLAETGADSYQLHLRGPWLLAEDYAPRFSVNLTVKDLRLGVRMAEAWGLRPELCAKALAWFERAQESGYGEEDTAAVYKVMSR